MNTRRLLFAVLLYLTTLPGSAATPTVAAGSQFALGLKSNGTVVSWGRNAYGQLGNGQAALRSVPAKVDGIDQVVALAAGGYFTLGLRADNTLWAWGSNHSGQLGDATTQSKAYPVRVDGISGTIVSVAAGGEFALALTADGKLWAWGYGGNGQLGTGDRTSRTTATLVSGLPADVRTMAAGAHHSLAITVDGSVWAWGSNAYGQLGNGTTDDALTPGKITALPDTIAISTFGYSNLALDKDGRVWAWGKGGWGALGDGSFDDRSAPFVVPDLPPIEAIKAGNAVSVAVDAEGGVWVWGDNEFGEFGDSQYTRQPSPVRVGNLAGIKEFALGAGHVIARDPDGLVVSWGSNSDGQLGTGDTSDRAVPTTVGGLPQVAQFATGYAHSVATADDGSVWTWGSNGSGQLADSSVAVVNVPAAVAGVGRVIAIAAGGFHNLALDADGNLWGWGSNTNAELGDSSRRNALVPKRIAGLPAMTSIAAGTGTSFAIDHDGTVWSWGDNASVGAVGQGFVSGVDLPGQITTLSEVSSISSTYRHTLAATRDGSVWSWGSNLYGQLGDGTTTDRSAPTPVVGLSNVVAVAAGTYHSLALDENGDLWAWGYNWWGQLGNGSDADSLKPVKVERLSNVVAISAGVNFSCAVTEDGRLWTWGMNTSGQLGDGTLDAWWPYPGAIPSVSDFGAVSCSNNFAVATRADGTVWSWGRNFEGQLGDGTFAAYDQPVLAINASLTDVLDLNDGAANDIPPGKTPPFLARAIRVGDLSRFSLTVDIKGLPDTGTYAAEGGRFAAAYNVYVAASVPSGGAPLYFQLDADNFWTTLQWPMAEYLRGVALDSQSDVIPMQILQNVDVSGLAGAEVLVGYGTGPDEMLGAGRYRKIFTVPLQ